MVETEVCETIASLGKNQDGIREEHRVLGQVCLSVPGAEMAKDPLHAGKKTTAS